jgi:NAD(P)-dependent dehydrogenase (short-subunit alcohol dehydrogenase family)
MGLALITGASSGTGLELAKRFAGQGYDLVVAAEDDGIQAAATTLSGSGVDVRSTRSRPQPIECSHNRSAGGDVLTTCTEVTR